MRDDLLKEQLMSYARDGAEAAFQPGPAEIRRRARRHYRGSTETSIRNTQVETGVAPRKLFDDYRHAHLAFGGFAFSFSFFLFAADTDQTFSGRPHHVDPVHRFFMFTFIIFA